MALGDRHQKKDVEAALKRAEAAGLKVKHEKKKHIWGYVICCPCREWVGVTCTPQNPGEEAKKVDGFIKRHRACV
ncbi:hypothetical protein ACFVIM_10855 [Streptomyces sp. NPDC057638]|uniref:hypothetical protein n=1 Tax=Streptomyces sp. NPDC057638 TaxID=3346190 RepID=UPI0036A53C69